jgi:hypothetical protein
MNKPDIYHILNANIYFTKCKLEEKGFSDKTDLARKYLVKSINKVLIERESKNSHIRTLFLNFISIFNF